jgi:hypothetical protein
LKFEKFKRFKRFEKFEKFERFKQVESIKRGRKFQTCTTQLKTWAMCKDICFLSGWAGYRELFPGLGGVEHFYVPFSPLGENDLKDIFLRHIHAQTLVAWSTGAHMILKWGDAVLNRFSHVVLVAPFLDFTRCLPVRIVKRMQDRLNKEGARVAGEFYATCGLPPGGCIPLEGVCISELVGGLEYLLHSHCAPDRTAGTGTNIHLVHGTKDRIVPSRAFHEVCSLLPQAAIHQFRCGHLVDESLFLSLIDTITP